MAVMADLLRLRSSFISFCLNAVATLVQSIWKTDTNIFEFGNDNCKVLLNLTVLCPFYTLTANLFGVYNIAFEGVYCNQISMCVMNSYKY